MTHECIDTMNAVLGYFESANARYILLNYKDDMSDGEPVMSLRCTVYTPDDMVRNVTVDVWRDRVWCKAWTEDGSVMGASIDDAKPMYHGLPLAGKREYDLMRYLCIDPETYYYC